MNSPKVGAYNSEDRHYGVAAGVKLRREALGPGFADYGMALQAALDGVGVAIGLRPRKTTSR